MNDAMRGSTPAVDLDEIRASCRHARRAVTGPARTAAEAAIASHLLSLVTLDRARSIAAYEAADGEPNLSAALDTLHGEAKTIALPIVEANTMWFRTAVPGGHRARGELGISVPTDGEDFAVERLDVVLVPLVAFSQRGQRCGRGRGYYDRTFGPVVKDGAGPLLIGIGFEAQRCDELPVRDHDVDLDAMVTEIGVRIFDTTRGNRQMAEWAPA